MLFHFCFIKILEFVTGSSRQDGWSSISAACQVLSSARSCWWYRQFLSELALMSFHALVFLLAVKAVSIGIAEAPRGPLRSEGETALAWQLKI